MKLIVHREVVSRFMTFQEIIDQIIQKHLVEGPLDAYTLSSLSRFHIRQTKASLDRLEAQQMIFRKKLREGGYVFAIQQ